MVAHAKWATVDLLAFFTNANHRQLSNASDISCRAVRQRMPSLKVSVPWNEKQFPLFDGRSFASILHFFQLCTLFIAKKSNKYIEKSANSNWSVCTSAYSKVGAPPVPSVGKVHAMNLTAFAYTLSGVDCSSGSQSFLVMYPEDTILWAIFCLSRTRDCNYEHNN